MVERLHPHVSTSRSINLCNNASVLARGKRQRKNRLEGGGAQASTEPGIVDEQCELHVDLFPHLSDVQPRGYFGPSQSAPPQTSGANRSWATSRTRLGGMIATTSISRNVGQEIPWGAC